MSLPAYPKYKPSGVEWLGDVPEGWSFERLKDVAYLKTSNVDKKTVEGQKSVLLCNYVDVYYNDKITSSIDFMVSSASEAEIEKFKLKKGDVVFTKDSESPFDIGIPSLINESIENLICGYHLSIVNGIENKLYGSFLYYALLSHPSVYQFFNAANGVTRFGLSQTGTKNIRIVLPLPDQQQTIADYLDTKTGQIDELIGKKKELIEKLKEQRTALITHAVTKGVDDSVPMKPSGVEWLGEIPEHWEVRRLKFLASEPLKYGANEAAELEDRDLPRFIRITDVNEDGSLKDESFRSLPIKIAEPFLLDDGDILLARSGATVGKSFLYSTDWGISAFAGYLIRFRVDKTNFNSRFAKYCLMSKGYWAWIQSSLIQATIQNVSAEKYANLVLPLPPLIEQISILTYLDKKTGYVDHLLAKTEEAIRKLEEYRIAVITATVTGKVKVAECKVKYLSFAQETLMAAEEMDGYGTGDCERKESGD